MKPSVYLETSFLSYAAAQFNSDILVLSRIQLSRYWWERYSKSFMLCVSKIVFDECLRGDPEAVQRRSQLLAETTALPLNENILVLANAFLERGTIPTKVANDAIHIACAAFYNCRFLLTWNFKHILNAFQSVSIRQIIEEYGYTPPLICTPESFLEE